MALEERRIRNKKTTKSNDPSDADQVNKKNRYKITVPQATVLASACSLASAVLVAWIVGFFDQSKTEISRIRDEAVEQVRKESAVKTEEIRQLTAKIVEDARFDGTVKLEKFKLQRDLILQAIETSDRVEAQKRLRFFAKTGLIPDYAVQVLSFTNETSITEIPSISATVDSLPMPRWGGEFPEIMYRIVRILEGGKSLCSGFAIDKSTILTLEHCVFTGKNPQFSVEQNGKLPSDTRINVMTVEKSTDLNTPYGADSFVKMLLSKEIAINLEELNLRNPELGEDVLVMGYAPSYNSFFRGYTLRRNHHRVAALCSVTEIGKLDMTLDCATPHGTSGNLIVGKSDGAILGMVVWGSVSGQTGKEVSGGPILNSYLTNRAGTMTLRDEPLLF